LCLYTHASCLINYKHVHTVMILNKNYQLKEHNTFGIEALCAYFAEISSEHDLINLLQNKDLLSEKKLPLGVGSNILFTKDFDGIILKNAIKGIEISGEDTDYVYIKSGAGVVWDDFVSYCVNLNLGGVENLIAIPGTVGASPVQNIGAYGQEAKDAFFRLEAVLLETGEKIELVKQQCNFGYRLSIFKRELKNKAFVTSVTYKLKKNPVANSAYGDIKKEIEATGKNPESIADVSGAIKAIRSRKLPDPAIIGSAGSFFKNPEVEEAFYKEIKQKYPEAPGYLLANGRIKIPAGWLIEKTGWKGKELGNVATYKNQALVIINKGGATGAEIVEFAGKIKESVNGLFKITLEEEVIIV